MVLLLARLPISTPINGAGLIFVGCPPDLGAAGADLSSLDNGGPGSLDLSDSFLKFFRLRVLACNNRPSNRSLPTNEMGSAVEVAGTGGKFLLRLSSELTESLFSCIIISFGPDKRRW